MKLKRKRTSGTGSDSPPAERQQTSAKEGQTWKAGRPATVTGEPEKSTTFLDLPAELRNHIYTLVVDHNEIFRYSLGTRGEHRRERLEKGLRLYSKWPSWKHYDIKAIKKDNELLYTNKWSEPITKDKYEDYYGVAQSCRQVRQEFLSLCMTPTPGTRIWIRLRTLPHFCKTLKTVFMDHSNNVACNLVIEMADTDGLPGTIDILPLVRMADTTPGLNVHFAQCPYSDLDPSGRAGDHQLVEFFKGVQKQFFTKPRAAWREFLQNAVSHVYLVASDGHWDHVILFALNKKRLPSSVTGKEKMFDLSACYDSEA